MNDAVSPGIPTQEVIAAPAPAVAPAAGRSGVRHFRWWLLALVVFAGVVRFVHLDWDQNHHFHPDERAVAEAVTRLSLDWHNPQLNPRFFAYGSLPFYLIRATSDVLVQFSLKLGSYDAVILIGRGVSAFVGTCTVLVLALLGASLYDRRTALLAGFLLAATPLHIQNSHFMTTDVSVALAILLALCSLVAVLRHGRLRDDALAGFAIGCAVATKFSALPLLAPLAVAALIRLLRERRPLRVAAGLALALAVGVAAFAFGEPYAFKTFAPGTILSALWQSLHTLFTNGPAAAGSHLADAILFPDYVRSIVEQGRMVRNAGVMPYTNQYIGVPKYLYEIRQMLWGMGPLLCLAALWGTGRRALSAVRERRAEELIFLSWLLPYFLITGWFEVKFPRYMLPIYPLVILWAAAALTAAARRSRLGRAALWSVAGTTALSALAFLSIYQRPHTIVTASEWVYKHIPSGSTLLTQHWDEGFPFAFPGRSPRRYTIHELPYYEPDTPLKIRNMARDLSAADYLAFQTKRLYGSITRAPEKFPLTNNYFYLLFAGDLGYRLEYSHASRPALFGLEFPDELADESLSVYDHPKVLIFRNVDHLSADDIEREILRGRPSRRLTRNDLLLSDAAPGSGIASGTVSPPIRSSLLALLCFAVVVELLALAAHPIVDRWLPVPGSFAFARVFGVLLFAYLPWLTTSLGITEFTRGTLAATLVLLAGCGLAARRRRRPCTSGGEWWTTEVLFWGTFAFFLAVRAYNPEVYWGEKPMDFSFLNALTRTTHLPPPEPWFSGSTLHYSYFGHFVVAALGKLCHLHPGITFNLGIALIAGLTASAAFAAGTALSTRWRIGLLAAIFTILIGNLSGLREVIGRQSINFDYFWATSRVIQGTINEYPLWSFLFADLHAHLLVMPFSLSFLALCLWWMRRENPLADGDASRLPALPLLCFLGLTLGAIMVTNTWSLFTYLSFFPFLLLFPWLWNRPRPRAFVWLLVALLLVLPVQLFHPDFSALQGFLSSWHGGKTIAFPALPAVPPWWYGERMLQARLGLAGIIGAVVMPRVVLPAAAVVGLAGLFYRPYWLDWHAPQANWAFEGDSFAHAYDFINIFGLFLAIALPFLFAIWRRRLLARGSRHLASRHTLAMWVVGLAILVFAALTIPFSQLGNTAALKHFLHVGAVRVGGPTHEFAILPSIRVALALLAVLGFRLALDTRTALRNRYILILLTFAFCITAGVDVIHLWDRMNTVFKFYLDAWLLFAVAGAAATAALWRGVFQSRLARRSWQAVLVLLLAMSLFTAGSATVGVLRAKRVRTPRPTLNGTAYLSLRNPHEAAAFAWLNREVAGIPVIAEAYGPSYQDFAQVSMNTGLPSVLGWDYHVQQRAQSRLDISRRKKDLEKLYTNQSKTIIAGILRKYHIALVFVGPVERRAYAGGNLLNFKKWDDLLTPLYQNAGVSIFGVIGQLHGALPVTTIEEVPSEAGAEVTVQAPPGEFRQPRGIAVDSKGNVYVADFDNNRIQKFDANLDFVSTWGEQGNLPGQFKQPCGVAIDRHDQIYVADTWNQRVQVFDTDGEYLREWGGSFFGPRGIAVSAQDKVYLADTGNHRIFRYDTEGHQEKVWGSLGSGPGQLREPFGLATDAEGHVYVCDNGNSRVQIFDADGKFLSQFPVPGWKSEVFSEPKIALTPDGTIWVTVPSRLVVRGYDRKGRLLREINGREMPMGLFTKPLGIAYSPLMKELFVTDLENRIARLPLPVR